MKGIIWGAVAAIALVLAGGCETLGEPVFLDRTVILEGDGFLVVEDHEEDLLGGSQWVQYTAFSFAPDVSYFVRVWLNSVDYSGGYSMGQTYRVPPNGEVDLGYVNLPARFDVGAQAWDDRADGTCGSPPPR